MMKVLFLVLLAVVAVNAQLPNDQVTIVLVDDFSVGGNVQNSIVTLTTDLTGPPSVVDDSTFNSPGCSGLVGCGRDMRMEAITGLAGRSFDSQIFLVSGGYFAGEWAVANPKTSSSVATIQYDGQDGAFDNLDVSGLSVDLSNNVESLTLSIITDLPSTYTMTLYSPNGNTCSASIAAPVLPGSYDYEDTFVEIPIEDFDGNCSLNNIGAIEIELPSEDAVDAIVRTIQFTGSIPETASPTPGPSPSQTPSQSPPPNLITWYTFDDDDNGVSPCGDEERRTYFIEDNEIIYYYFFGVEVADVTTSSASILSAGIAMIATFFLF